MRVVFFQVRSNKTKIQRIIETVNYHFTSKNKFLIITPDEISLKFVDELLWKDPINSFIPHFICDDQLNEKVVITMKRENLNSAKYIFNLCPTPLMIDDIDTIYEFEDFTASGKQALFREKYKYYKKKEFSIQSKLS